MICTWELTNIIRNNRSVLRCTRCKREALARLDSGKVEACCRAWPYWQEFGEWCSIALGVIGITSRKWTWVEVKLGLIKPGQVCNCNLYREWLNTLGGRVASSTNFICKWLASRFIRVG